MSLVIIFSRFFPSYHPRKGEPTLFVEKLWKGLQTNNHRDGEYSIWTNIPRLMKDGHWQLPHLWRDQMMDKKFFPKYHTIRAGNRWKVGDKFSPRIWSALPYRSKQIQIAPDIEVKKVFEIYSDGILWWIDHQPCLIETKQKLFRNDGFDNQEDFIDWFNLKQFSGQIICWNNSISY